MNILIKSNKSDVNNTIVMLISLLRNNRGINISCCYNKADAEIVKLIERTVEEYGAEISLFPIEGTDSTIEIEYILKAPLFFESDCERALYLGNDNIINGDILDFYNSDFEQNLLVARGQTYDYLDGFREGARPERSQLFDCRVLLLNLKQFRSINIYELVKRSIEKYGKCKTFAANLNCIFYDNTKIVYDVKYNIRHSIYSDAEAKGADLRNVPMKIISYERRDYYGIGLQYTPWEYYIEKSDYERLICSGQLSIEFERNKTYEISKRILDIWEEYRKQSNSYDISLKRYKIENYAKEVFFKNQIANQLKESVLSNSSRINNEVLKSLEYIYISRVMDSLAKEEAIKLIQLIHMANLARIKAQKRVRVGFVVHSSSEWQCEMLYHKMSASNRFFPQIIVGYQKQGVPEAYYELRDKTYRYFKDQYDVLNSEEAEKQIDDFDVLIYISPYDVYPETIKVENRKANQIIIHIPYSYYLVSKTDAIYTEPFYERTIMKIAWLVCASNSAEIEIAKNLQRLRAYNFINTGFPKMDNYIINDFTIRNDIWGKGEGKRIIWAPHFNMAKGMNGTFQYNYLWFLEYARMHPETKWIVRPHPRFASGAIDAGVFLDVNEVNRYFMEWDRLPNAKVIDGGGYYDLFKTSDAMILDSISFLAEYQFTSNPLLFLFPEIPRGMNKLGNEILEVVYKARGDDFETIENFINNLIEEEDKMKIERENFFRKRLDYYGMNGKLATDFIMDKICEMMG